MDIFISDKNYIDSFDLKAVCEAVKRQERWSTKDIAYVCQQYRNFIFLCKKYSHHKLPPSKEIDIFWHNHILHTESYITFCKILFGEYYHHSPTLEHPLAINSYNEEFKLTQELYKKEFGTYIFSIKSKFFSVPKFIYTIAAIIQQTKKNGIKWSQ